MNVRRILTIASLMALAIVVIAGAPLASRAWHEHVARVEAQPRPLVATPQEHAAIVHTALTADDWPRRSPAPPPPGNLSEAVRAYDTGLYIDTIALQGECEPSPLTPNMVSCPIGAKAGEAIGAAEYDSRFPLGWRRELVAANADAGRLIDPRVPGIRVLSATMADPEQLVFVSRAVLSRDRREALLYAQSRSRTGALCVLFRLIRDGQAWRVAEKDYLCVGV